MSRRSQEKCCQNKSLAEELFVICRDPPYKIGYVSPHKRAMQVTEPQVTQFVTSHTAAAARGLTFILGSIFGTFPYDTDGFEAARELDRQQLNLKTGVKPGDIDILIIPWKGNRYLYTHSCAIEVKVVRPTLENPGRNANSYGVSQAKGLVRDGFPFVGLMHVVVPGPLPQELQWDLPVMETVDGEFKEVGRRYFDYFSWAASERQAGRMDQFDLPSCVGASAFAAGVDEEYRFDITLASGDFVKVARLNPNVSFELIASIEAHHQENRDQYTRTVWFEDKDT